MMHSRHIWSSIINAIPSFVMKSICYRACMISLLSGWVLITSCSPETDQTSEQPNVIIIITDDQGYQDLGCYGSPDIKTPHLDRLAAQGMRFTDFYVASSVCSASRAALLTGRYPRHVVRRNVFFPNQDDGMDPQHETIAEVLKPLGYATKAVGKWHLGDELRFLPTNQGFDSYYGIPYSNDMSPALSMAYAEDCVFREGITPEGIRAAYAAEEEKVTSKQKRVLKDKVPLMRDTECIEMPADQTTITRRFTDESIRFISESHQTGQPFFLYLAHSMPHIPLFTTKEFKGKSAGGVYGDVIEEIDFNVGRILQHLDQLHIAENTIVIFMSDNGPWLVMGENGGLALPLFEGKMTNFEGGQRVPAIVRWTERVPAGSICSEMALSMDLLPTLAAITGASLPEAPLDGRNILDLMTAEVGAVTPHDFFFYGNQAVRSGDWKYHRAMSYKLKATKREDAGPALYHLGNDIGESQNVIEEYPEVAEQLRQALIDHNRSFSKK